MDWYIVKSGKEKEGPFSTQELQALIAARALEPSTLVWREGMSDWVPLAKVAELDSVADPESSAGREDPPAEPNPVSKSPTDPLEVDELRCYLIPAILSTILLCPPFGIPAIIYSVHAEDLKAKDRWEEARLPSRLARRWTLIAIGAGLAGWVYFGLIICLQQSGAA